MKKEYSAREVAIKLLKSIHKTIKDSEQLIKANTAHEIELGEEPRNDDAECPPSLAADGSEGGEGSKKKKSPAADSMPKSSEDPEMEDQPLAGESEEEEGEMEDQPLAGESEESEDEEKEEDESEEEESDESEEENEDDKYEFKKSEACGHQIVYKTLKKSFSSPEVKQNNKKHKKDKLPKPVKVKGMEKKCEDMEKCGEMKSPAQKAEKGIDKLKKFIGQTKQPRPGMVQKMPKEE